MLPAVAPLQLRASPLLLRRSRYFCTTETTLVAFCFASLIVFQFILVYPLDRSPLSGPQSSGTHGLHGIVGKALASSCGRMRLLRTSGSSCQNSTFGGHAHGPPRREPLYSMIKFFQVDNTGMCRMTSSARYF